MSNESIIIDIEPFPNPVNGLEEKANEIALDWYNNTEARENTMGQTMYAVHPDDATQVYFVNFGWTSGGWRTYAVILSEYVFKQWARNTREFVTAYLEESVRRQANMFGISVDQIDNLVSTLGAGVLPDDDTLNAVAAKLASQPDCGDPTCPVHGGLPFDGAKLKASLSDRFEIDFEN